MAPLPTSKCYSVPRGLMIVTFDRAFDGNAQPPRSRFSPPTSIESNLPRTISSFSESILPVPSISSSLHDVSGRSTPSVPPTPPNTPTENSTAIRAKSTRIRTGRKRVRFEGYPDDDEMPDRYMEHSRDSNQPVNSMSLEDCWRGIASSLRSLEENPKTWSPGPGVTAAVETINKLVTARRFEGTLDTTLSIRGTALSNTLKVLGDRLSLNSLDQATKTEKTSNGNNSAALIRMATEARIEFYKWMYDTSVVSKRNEGGEDSIQSHSNADNGASNMRRSLPESSIG